MFRDVKNYEGLYQVNEEGQIRSLPRTIINKNGKNQFYPGKILRQELKADGRRRVTFSKNHKTKRKI